ncbi:MAG: GGDEF domain-containing protein [Planctomycetota bacterium]
MIEAEQRGDAEALTEIAEHMRRPLGTATRAVLMVIGVAGMTGLSVLTGAALGYELRSSVLFALPAGTAVGVLFAILLVVMPATRAAADRTRMIARIESVAQADREASFDVLLAIDEEHELAELARAMHAALSSAHRDRLEAARVRREMNALVEREARKRYAHLTTLSMTDELTGLANRRGFERGLRALFDRSVRRGTELALLAIDLDHFKQLNDTCGHEKGDEALAAAGDLLQAHLRDGDLAGRMGGDELFVALYDVDGERAQRVANRLIECFSEHPAGEGLPCPWPGMSIGVSMRKLDGAGSPAELRRFADRALYASKRGGRSRATLFRSAA